MNIFLFVQAHSIWDWLSLKEYAGHNLYINMMYINIPLVGLPFWPDAVYDVRFIMWYTTFFVC